MFNRIHAVKLTTKHNKHTKMGTKQWLGPSDLPSPNGGQHFRNAQPHFLPVNVLCFFRVIRVFRGPKELFRFNAQGLIFLILEAQLT